MIDGAAPAGYLTPDVVPVGAGPEQIQRVALAHRAAPWRPFSDAVANRYNDVVAVGFDPRTNTWASPQDQLVNFPATSAANYLALQYAAPGSAGASGLPGRPMPFRPAVPVDGSVPSLGG